MGSRRKYRRLLCMLVTLSGAYILCNYLIKYVEISEKHYLQSNMDHSHHHHAMDDAPHHEMAREHNHGGGGEDSAGGMHMMAMVFHTSVQQDILFPGWTSTNAGEMVGACVVMFLAGILYEGLKSYRETLFRSGASTSPASSQVNITKQECGPDGNCSGQKIVRYPMLSGMHSIQTLLHMIQIFFSYLLMLVVMTYNVWLCLALILGTGLGYFLFAWRKHSVVDSTEHCQ